MIAFTIIPLVTFVGYVLYIYRRFGVLPSISASTDHLGRQERNLFVAFCWIIGLSLFFHDMGMWWAMASGGLFFTGITLRHSDPDTDDNWIHKIAAIGAITLFFLGILIHGENWWIPLGFVLSCLPLLRHENRIWWIEVLAFSWVFLFLLIKQ